MSVVKAKWVLLHSNNKKSVIGRYKDTGLLVFNDFVSDIVRGESFEVYVTVDEPIRLGDWGIGHQLGVCEGQEFDYLFFNDGSNLGKLNSICHGARKVVASTDVNLNMTAPDRSFLKELVFSYNNEFSESIKNKLSGDAIIEYNSNWYYKDKLIGVLFYEVTEEIPTFTAYELDGTLIAKNEKQSELYQLPKSDENRETKVKIVKETFTIDDVRLAYEYFTYKDCDFLEYLFNSEI
jgi:hypothetical protein